MTPKSNLILDVRGLTTQFGSLKAVDQISFALPKGKTLGIVGESGSGKSVTALSIMRLIQSPGQITGGEIHFHSGGQDSVDLLRLSEEEMRTYRGKKIGLIFQEPFSAFNPSYTCGSQIKESLDIHHKLSSSESEDRIFNLLERVGINDPKRLYKSYPHELSGGQLQRALIAMAVICKPDLIIADEPTTALDVTIQKNVLDVFRGLVEELNASVIFISHDLGLMREIADDVMVMYRGRVMESGPIENIFSQPQHPYTKGLLECRPRLNRLVRRLPVVSDFMEVIDDDVNDWKVIEKDSRQEAHLSEEKAKSPDERRQLIAVQNLVVNYPLKRNFWGKVVEEVKAVKNVSFEVLGGETLGLVGESGSGKSSVGKAMLRLITASSGQVMYQGRDILKLSKNEMRRARKDLQIVFQDPYSTLNPRMTIGDAIMEVLSVHGFEGDKKNRLYTLLNTVGLTKDHAMRYPHQFSGGQRQRISIARTLAVNPKFIVCDESVSALDVSVQAQILNLLKDLQDEFGLSYLFISHDLSVVKHMSDRLLVMKEGEIVEEGLPSKIYESPKSDYTRQLISAIPGNF